MKKFLALALALVMALALAVPAMAFTSAEVEEEAAVDYQLSVELVEFDAGFNATSVFTSAAPSDRGYAKNEVVAAIVSFIVPKGKDMGDYKKLVVTGENVSLCKAAQTVNAAGVTPAFADVTEGSKMEVAVTSFDATEAAKAITAKWLVYARVTGDDASITATLTEGVAAPVLSATTPLEMEIDDVNYKVTMGNVGTSTDISFTVTKGTDTLFVIVTDKKGVSKSLTVGADGLTVGLDNDGCYTFTKGDKSVMPHVEADEDAYEALVEIIEDVFEDAFGFDFALLGGAVNAKTFTGMIADTDISFTADIQPWVAYVQVPDVIVVDPPKTGDATVLVGIVMAIVAAAGVVVFNKVRA